MYKPPKSIVSKIAILFTLFFVVTSLHAKNYDLDEYINFYEYELERIITRSEEKGSYDDYKNRLEVKLNILKALWEKDKDRLKARMVEKKEGNDNLIELELIYAQWEKKANDRFLKAKASYITGKLEANEEDMGKIKSNLMKLLSDSYYKLLEKINAKNSSDSDKGGLFQGFRDDVIIEYGKQVSNLEKQVDKEYDKFKSDLKDTYALEGIEGGYLDAAIEEKKKNVLYDKKIFLTTLVNSYTNRASYEIFSDKSSLRLRLEEERARREACEIESNLNDELEKDVKERLDKLLSQKVMTEKDVASLEQGVNNLYDKGLEIWAKEGADLVKRENEWYKNYNDVYNDGVSAWVDALTVLKQKKDEWVEEFSNRIEDGLNNWDVVFEEIDGAKRKLLLSLNQYKVDRGKDFDAYIGHLTKTLDNGSSSICGIDKYIEEFNLMIRDTLSPFTKKELNRNEIKDYIQLFECYIGNSNRLFEHNTHLTEKLYYVTPLTDIFDCIKHIIPYSGASKTDKIIGQPFYRFLSESLNNGFRLNIEISCEVRRYWYKFDGVFKGWCFHNRDSNEKRYYTIDYTCNNDIWSKISHVPKEETNIYGYKEPPNLDIIANDLNRYLDIIDSLNNEKQKVLNSITNVQASVIEKLTDNKNLLDDPLLTDEEAFNNRFFNGTTEFLMNNFDKELYRAYYERKFWSNQFDIIDDVLDYVLDKADREYAQDTITNYEEAKDNYNEAVDEYEGLLQNELVKAEDKIKGFEDALCAKKEELAQREEALRKALNRVSALKVSQANLDMLVSTMFEQVDLAIQKKHDFLERIFNFNEEKEQEVVGNLLKKTLFEAQIEYAKIIENGLLVKDGEYNIEKNFIDEFTDSKDFIEKLVQTNLMKDITQRIESGYYKDRTKGSIHPVSGNLDSSILYTFAYMDTLEKNGMLSAKLESFLRTMAEYIASYIYLAHEDDLESVKQNPDDLEECINKEIIRYFNNLKTIASTMGFTEDEKRSIQENMESYLVSRNADANDDIKSTIIDVGTEELGFLIDGVSEVIDELSYFNTGDYYDIDGYFNMVLSGEDRFNRLITLNSLLPLELEEKEDYEKKLAYSEKLNSYLNLSSEKRLEEVFSTEYISEMFKENPKKALDLVSNLSSNYIISHEISQVIDFSNLYTYINGDFTHDVLSRISIEKSNKSNFIEDILFKLNTSIKIYEAEMKKSGSYDNGVIFSRFTDDYISYMNEIENEMASYKANHNIDLYFDSFVEYINDLSLITNLSNEEISLIKKIYLDEEMLQYEKRHFEIIFQDSMKGLKIIY